MTHFEYMQSVGQLTIDDILSGMPSTDYGPGDNVRIQLDESDDETYNYFKYYYPHINGKSGHIVEGKRLSNGHVIYLIEVMGELHWMNEGDII